MISSSEVSNIISAQLSQASQAQAYSANLAPSNVRDFGAQAAGNAAVATASAIPAAAMLGNMVGALPNAFDPFSGTLGAVGTGWRAAGGMSNFGGAVAAGLGTGMVAMGGYMAAGSALKAMTNALMQGVQEQLAVNNMMSQSATRSAMPLMGGLNPSMGPQFGGMIRNMASSGGREFGDAFGIVQQGMNAGMFRGAQNFDQFQSQAMGLSNMLMGMSSQTGMSSMDSMAAMQRMQGYGFYSPSQAANAAIGFQGLSTGLGVNQGMFESAMTYGGQASVGMGMGRARGAKMAAGLATRMGTSTLMDGGLSSSQLMDMTGASTLEDAVSQMSGQMSQTAMSLAASNRNVMAALIDPETGQLDSGKVLQFQSGSLSGRALDRLGRKNLRNIGVRSAIGARGTSLAASLVDQMGPEAMISGMASAKFSGRGIKAGENAEDVESMLLQQYTGLGEDQANVVQQMMNAGPEIRAESSRLMKAALDEQKRATTNRNTYSFAALKQRMINATVGPVIERIKGFGADVANWGSDLAQQGVEYLFGTGPSDAKPFQANEYGRAALANALGSGTKLPGVGSYSGGRASYDFGVGRTTGPRGAFEAWAPGLDNGYSGVMSAMGPAVSLAGLGSGALMTSGINSLSEAWGGVKFSTKGLGFMDGAAALASGMGSTAKTTAWGLGKTLLGGAGRLLGGVGLAMTAYDVVNNVAPAARGWLGLDAEDMDMNLPWKDPDITGRLDYARSGELKRMLRGNGRLMGELGVSNTNSQAMIGSLRTGFMESNADREDSITLSGSEGLLRVQSEKLGEFANTLGRAALGPRAYLESLGISPAEVERLTKAAKAGAEDFYVKNAQSTPFSSAPYYDPSAGNRFVGGIYGDRYKGLRERSEGQKKAMDLALGGLSGIPTEGSALALGRAMSNDPTSPQYYRERGIASLTYQAKGVEHVASTKGSYYDTGEGYGMIVPGNAYDKKTTESEDDARARAEANFVYLEEAAAKNTKLGAALRKQDIVEAARLARLPGGDMNVFNMLIRRAPGFSELGDGGGVGLLNALGAINSSQAAAARAEMVKSITGTRDAVANMSQADKYSLQALIGGSADNIRNGSLAGYNAIIESREDEYSGVTKDMLAGFGEHTAEERAEAAWQYGQIDPTGGARMQRFNISKDAYTESEKMQKGRGMLGLLATLPGASSKITGAFTKSWFKTISKRGGELVGSQLSQLENMLKVAIPDADGDGDDMARRDITEGIQKYVRDSKGMTKKEKAASVDAISGRIAQAGADGFLNKRAGGKGGEDSLKDFSSTMTTLAGQFKEIVGQAGAVINGNK